MNRNYLKCGSLILKKSIFMIDLSKKLIPNLHTPDLINKTVTLNFLPQGKITHPQTRLSNTSSPVLFRLRQ
jgi:hypothetical protein